MNQEQPQALEHESHLVELVEKIGLGNAIAFESLYRATSKTMAAMMRALCPSHAEDIVAETYFQIWKSAHTFDPSRCSVRGWMAMIARSRCIDVLRRDIYRHDGEMHRRDLELDDLPQTHSPSVEDAVAQAQAASLLHCALAGLKARERQLLTLCYFHALSHSEIASFASMPLGSVKTTIRRSLQQLRAAFQVDDIALAT